MQIPFVTTGEQGELSTYTTYIAIRYFLLRFLYKQRIFQLSIPKLVEGYKAAKGEVKANFIRALTGQLRHVPQVVLQMELNNVRWSTLSCHYTFDSRNRSNRQPRWYGLYFRWCLYS